MPTGKTQRAPAGQLQTLNDLAAYLNVSRRTIYRLDDRGLPVLRVGYVLRFDLPTVLKWITKFTEEDKRLTWHDELDERVTPGV